jgi:SOS response regulatory protein OraA/RecX
VPPPTVSALRAVGRGRVAVDLDGARWRVLPLEATVRAGLGVGSTLDRPAAARLARELRRVRAQAAALRALHRRDHTEASLRGQLARRGIAPADRDEAVAAARRAGYVDDRRLARRRAAALAERGAGDLLIAADLERRGLAAPLVREALAAIAPERARAAAEIAARGRTPSTLRRLAARGFAEQTIAEIVAEMPEETVG